MNAFFRMTPLKATAFQSAIISLIVGAAMIVFGSFYVLKPESNRRTWRDATPAESTQHRQELDEEQQLQRLWDAIDRAIEEDSG